MSNRTHGTWIGPKAREENITCEEVLDECVVYDLERNTAHSLNETAAQIWRRCDGRTDVDGLAAYLSQKHGVDAPDAKPLVDIALGDLADAQLLEPGSFTVAQADMTRRKILSRIAVGSLGFLIPAVYSLTAPPSTVHACGPEGGTTKSLERFGFDFEVSCRDDSDCPAGSKCVSGECR